ncbi:MAG: hydrogenase formation protein HypD [Nevskia sp.]|nr:hydrogenase formation protein HypD [Nevskia sp.]
MRTAADWLQAIRGLPLRQEVRVLNVCGGHERTMAQAGLRGVLPPTVKIIPGPGCPVCICPEEDVFEAIQLALTQPVTLVAFGDMLRVPVGVPKGQVRSLEQAKAAGADVRPLASPEQALAIARDNPARTVVFFVAGFETTLAPVAAMIRQGVPDNLLFLMSGRLTWPAVAMLLESADVAFDALVAPGHVATVMGSDEWQFVVRDHQMPAAIGGFKPESLLAAVYSVLRQQLEGQAFLDNCYAESVRPAGNRIARQCLDDTLEVVDARWRGIGTIPSSGFRLRPALAHLDARLKFGPGPGVERGPHREMPPGCDCARVILGKVLPSDCYLYGRACTPRTPVGPCMVSDEGACHVWWTGGVRANPQARPPAGTGS